MSDWSNLKTADRRLCVLRLLDEERDGSLNESLLQSALALLSHKVSRDVIRNDLRWLEEQNLVKVHVYGERIFTGEILERGSEAAKGLIDVEGVARPSRGR